MQDRTTHEAFAICRRPSQFGHSDYVYKLDTSRAKKKKITTGYIPWVFFAVQGPVSIQ